ncbi:DinB family protein [Alkalicoccus saliphilus]|jgi:hypothetical protein|uniref:DinB-like domain-containing protein n=1 Tax=Alkalicoccus saliphilus TaxID=200989 RepID=A0A2T4U3P0_9BACI|nr:DinB family protein [Alkalicoccus saliphilus]PTL38006.1 hypothetical protein C6Y45_13400 [Alkalicoccus saliphilus]
MGRVQDYQHSIKEKMNYFIEQGEKLDEELFSWKPSSEEWSIQEITAHVAEFPLYFTSELLGVVKDGQEKWGRGLDHPERLEAVNKAFDASQKELVKNVQSTSKEVEDRLGSLKDEDLDQEQEHRNPKFGNKSMEFLVEHFLVEHLDKHINQHQRVQSQYADQKQ